MDQATLVGPDVIVGNEAVAVLEQAHIKLVFAALVVFPEYSDWRLVLSSPNLDQTHLLKAHDKVAQALHGHFSYTLPIIMILPTRDPFIKELRGTFGKSKSVLGMRLGGQTIGSRFISDAYLYLIR